MTEPPPSPFPRVRSGDLTSDFDLTAAELRTLLDLAAQVKRHPQRFRLALRGRILSLLFEKPSLRTRMTFEVAAKQLGGDALLTTGPIGGREPVEDVARNLERWTDLIVARTFSQATVDALARHARIPVVNALSDRYHPCQALADLQTFREVHGGFDGRALAYVGDGNNVAHSLLFGGAKLGLHVSLAVPPDFARWETIGWAMLENRQFLVRTPRAGDPIAFQNYDETGQHTPGPDAEAVRFLVDERDVLGFGSEAIGTDAGQAYHLRPPYPCHYYMHGAGRYGLQCLANLDQLPPTGAIVVAAPLKIREGSGSPLRVIALVPA